MWRNRKGQSMAEYALLVVIILGAVVGMQAYFKRGMQARIKAVVDGVNTASSADIDANTITQYEPYYASSEFQVTQGTTRADGDLEEYQAGGTVHRESGQEVTRATGGFTKEAGSAELSRDDGWNR